MKTVHRLARARPQARTWATLDSQARPAGACAVTGLQIGQVTRSLRRCAGGISQEHKCGSLGGLFREGVVEYEAVHAAVIVIHVPSAHGYLVGLAFPMPMYDPEALLCQLFLGVARILLREDALLAALRGAIEGVGRFFGLVDGEVGAAAAGMLDNSKIAAVQVECISIELRSQGHKQELKPRADSHGLLVRLDTP